MESRDPAKNDENTGFSKRRISSILKAPRKSIRFPDPELQENKVESAKPMEKRTSRRVSFAPANDVLLFSKDVKNTSPARGPFQELITTAATQNRVQVGGTDSGIQPITGMETLLNAPLHASQQKDVVNFDTGDAIGEKTVIFTDDVFMDMTHSDTINIGVADMSVQDCDTLPTSRDKTDDMSMDLTLNRTVNMTASLPTSRGVDFSAKKENSASSGPCLDSVGFADFLANLFPTKSNVADLDKENQAPVSVSAVMERSLNEPRKTDQSTSQRSLLHPQDDVSMEMTETVASHVQGFVDEADPFQCLFPTKEMYSHFHNGEQKTEGESKRLQSSKTAPSLNPKGTTSVKSPSLRDRVHKVNLDASNVHREKTIIASGDEFMDFTQSHTVNIARASYLHTGQQVLGPSNNAETPLMPWLQTHQLQSKEDRRELSADDDGMEMTQSHSASIATNLASLQRGQPRKTDMTSHPPHGQTFRSSSVKSMEISSSALLMSKAPKHQLDAEDDRERTTRFTAADACMDETQSYTVNILSDLQIPSSQKSDSLPACGDRTVRFSVADAAMDMTQSHTASIVTGPYDKSHQFGDFLPGGGERTVKFSLNDACMDVTQSHTVNIATNLCPPSHKWVDSIPGGGEKTVRFSAIDAAMDETRSYTTNIATGLNPKSQKDLDLLVPKRGEQTMRFSSNDACMDVTQSHTTNIETSFKPRLGQNVNFLPSSGEKTIRFASNDACMDVTQSHTTNIATTLKPRLHQNADPLAPGGNKTMRFSSDDAVMDVTKSHTVDIVSSLKPQSHQNLDSLPAPGEKTTRFSSNDATMDVTRSHTTNIATSFAGFLPGGGEEASSCDVAKVVAKSCAVNTATSPPASGEKTVRFSSNDATMDVTQSHTVYIATGFGPQLHSNGDPLPTCKDKMVACTANNSAAESDSRTQESDSHTQESTYDPLSVRKSDRGRVPSVHTLDPVLQASLSQPHVSSRNPLPAAKLPQESVDRLETHLFDIDTKMSASAVTEDPINKSMPICPEEDVSMDLTEVQTDHKLGNMYADDPPLSLPSSDVAHKEQGNEALAPLTSDGVEVTNRPQSLGPDMENPQSSSDTSNSVDAAASRKSKRLSLADLQSKVRRLSYIVNTVPDPVTTDEDPELGENARDKSSMEPQPEAVVPYPEENTLAHGLLEEEGEEPAMATFNLKTKHLMSRLSMGGFKPKLPKRSSGKKTQPGRECTKTVTVTASTSSQLEDFDGNVSDIYDEELASCEDTTDVLEARSPQREAETPAREWCDEEAEDNLFEEELLSTLAGKKRPLPEDDCPMEDEKRMKRSTGMSTDSDTGLQSMDGNTTTAGCTVTQPTDDSSISHTASMRCEATFNSTFKQSMYESQLEDYSNDTLRKLENGNITMSEFFKLCNIDFVIHNPRQSVLPGRLLSDSDRTPMDSLRDRHIHRPKQMVYKTNVGELTEQVEGLKERRQDLDKPLRTVNRALWEEVRNCSQAEFKSFAAKLKERNNLFRKTGKLHSHEMKEALYSKLVQAGREEQQSLKSTIEEADRMIKSLDDCIHELETELTAVEEKGGEGTQSLKSLQEEMQSVTRALEENNRQICELEVQREPNAAKLSRLKAETRNSEDHIRALHMLTEWRLGEKTDNHAVYTFLHDTLHLQVVYQKSTGKDVTDQRKISHIAFKRQLDDERSQGHACLVHGLLSQYIEGEAAWAQNYPTSRHVPQLLHDVSLSVSHCRLLGEELRLLKMWGALTLGILTIDCSDAQVRIIFSSLKRFSKFEVVFSVSLINHQYVLQLHSFRSIIGSTTVRQIEEIVASYSPARNILTKIIKKIHATFLS